jgi:hypothetical protein
VKTRSITRPITRKRNRRITQRGMTAVSPAGRRAAGVLTSVLLGAGMLVGVGFAVQYGWRTLRDTNRLQVQSIEVLGSTRVQWDELEAYTELHVGDPILDLDLDGIALGLRRHPWIAAAAVRRRLPDHVALELTEHVPGILVSLGELYIADRDGHLFKRLQAQDRVVLPVLTGLSRDLVAARTDEGAGLILDGIALAAAMAVPEVEQAGGALEELHYDPDLGWSAVVSRRGSATVVHLGKEPVARIDLALAALRRLDRLGRPAREVWADGPGDRRRVQVSMRTSESASNPTLIAKAGE